MDYTGLLLTIVKVALLMGIGMAIAYKIALTADVKRFLVLTIVNVALPSIVLNGFFRLTVDSETIRQLMIVFAASVSLNVAGMLLSWAIAKGCRFPSQKARESGYLSTFGNTALIGIPLAASVLGPKGAVLAAVFDFGTAFTMMTLGMAVVQKERESLLSSLKLLVSTPMIAMVIGFMSAIVQFRPGAFVTDFVATLSGVSLPLSMIYIGMMLLTMIRANRREQRQRITFKWIALPSVQKLLVFPLLGIAALSVLSLPPDVETAILLGSAMPTLANASIFMALAGADEEYAITTTMLTSILCLFTIPLVVYVGGMFI